MRTINQFGTLEDIENLYIATREGRSIRLSDIATVSSAYKEQDSMTRFDGLQGSEIAIYKEGDANSVTVAERVQQALQGAQDQLPAGYQLSLVYDQSEFIGQAISDVQSAGIIGGVLAMLIIYLFLRSFWPTLIISVSIPVSIIATLRPGKEMKLLEQQAPGRIQIAEIAQFLCMTCVGTMFLSNKMKLY